MLAAVRAVSRLLWHCDRLSLRNLPSMPEASSLAPRLPTAYGSENEECNLFIAKPAQDPKPTKRPRAIAFVAGLLATACVAGAYVALDGDAPGTVPHVQMQLFTTNAQDTTVQSISSDIPIDSNDTTPDNQTATLSIPLTGPTDAPTTTAATTLAPTDAPTTTVAATDAPTTTAATTLAPTDAPTTTLLRMHQQPRLLQRMRQRLRLPLR
ncbi:Aste57867_459 [Aphanomyces stellatus]|uniref:Aste57867_459 protein n=1 Tax=Aphanomyces stellatus TaxID=120398 RepID=A0A485K6T2_9STRA|nr:hypothetical protein As57867_000458 [Aphanomyces stellatus]VFT77684.1 Aste57867_459 [Aphanomyces stellatus]